MKRFLFVLCIFGVVLAGVAEADVTGFSNSGLTTKILNRGAMYGFDKDSTFHAVAGDTCTFRGVTVYPVSDLGVVFTTTQVTIGVLGDSCQYAAYSPFGKRHGVLYSGETMTRDWWGLDSVRVAEYTTTTAGRWTRWRVMMDGYSLGDKSWAFYAANGCFGSYRRLPTARYEAYTSWYAPGK